MTPLTRRQKSAQITKVNRRLKGKTLSDWIFWNQWRYGSLFKIVDWPMRASGIYYQGVELWFNEPSPATPPESGSVIQFRHAASEGVKP